MLKCSLLCGASMLPHSSTRSIINLLLFVSIFFIDRFRSTFRRILLPLCLGNPMVLLLQFTYTIIFEEIGVVASSGCITSVDDAGCCHYYNIERDNAATILI
jgi:hypothetical protein